MRVWLVQTGEPLLQPGMRPHRTGLLARALVARGHEVVWWSTSFDHDTKAFLDLPTSGTLEPGIGLRLVRGVGYTRNVSVRRFLGNRLVARRFTRMARQASHPDIMVLSMPDYHIAAAAARLAQAWGIPIVVDVRDPWPDIFATLVPSWAKPAARVALAPDRAVLRGLLRRASSVTSMMSSLHDWALERAGRPAGPLDKVFPLGGDPVPTPSPSAASPEVQAMARRLEGRFVVAFVGTFGRFTDPSVLAHAAGKAAQGGAKSDRDLAFLLVGDGPGFAGVAELVRGLSNVEMPGRLVGNDLATVLACAHVAVLPAPPGFEALPNKFFTYLAAGLPVVSCVQGELQGILQNEGVGLAFRADDSDDLLSRLRHLRDHEVERTKMAAAARRLFERAYDARAVYDAFARHVEDVARRDNR